MKINISTKRPERPRPETPSVSLTPEAYSALLELSAKHNVSMRKLASVIIVQALAEIDIEIEGDEQ